MKIASYIIMKGFNGVKNLILDEAPCLLSYVDNNGKYVYVNTAYERWFGKSFNQLVGRHIKDVLGEKAFATIENYFKKALSGEQVTFEREVPYKDGGTRIVQATYVPHLSSGKVQGFTVFVQDITDQKKLESQSEIDPGLLYRTIIESIPNHFIWVSNSSGKVIYVNPEWTKQTGKSAEEASGGQWIENVHPEDRERLLKNWKNAIQNDAPSYQDIARFIGSTGQYCRYTIFARSLKNVRGETTHWVGINANVEDLLRAKEEAERANLAKSQFLAFMSHEIRTPLSAISGYSELLSQRAITPEEQSLYLNSIKRNTEHLLRLVDDLLDLSQIESGKLEVNIGKLNLPNLIYKLESMFKPRAQARGINLDFKSLGEIPETIESDEKLIMQILINLIGNSLKFTEKGHVYINIKMRELENDKVSIVFVIEDTGVGIVESSQEIIFESYFRDPLSKKDFKGTGLGLPLAKALAKHLNGNLKLIFSKSGIGSVFEFEFKAKVSSNTKWISFPKISSLKQKKIAPTTTSSLAGVRILVIEDNLDLQFLIDKALSEHGAIVSTADNGFSGIESALNNYFDIVLMDLQMPILSGHEAIKILRAKNYKDTVIALTAHASRDERKNCLLIGFDECLSKPIQGKKLVETMLKFVKTDFKNQNAQ